ncbi:MAG: hypothetical protein Q9220_000104 [cf. Caloplaca sp. 1 TL-2023]
MASSTWALSQISRILPLDEQSLQEVLDYSFTLSKDASAEHLRNLLGTSPQALEFISSFNSRRETPKSESRSSTPEIAERSMKPRKKKQPLNKPFNPRQPDDYGNIAGGYQKKNEDDFVATKGKQHKEPALANALALSEKPDARQLPIPVPASGSPSPKHPPSASGPLISDLPNVKTISRTASRTSSPAPKTKINVAGGASMHGASTTLQDLDSAIRALELQTNPSTATSSSPSSRACTCNATRHPLLAAAPNCLSCGKIICVKEGIGPCTFCSTPLLSPPEINAMIRSLREERGREKMTLNNTGQKRAEVASTTRPFTKSATAAMTENAGDEGLLKAKEHRDKLLNYQSENARRTHIIDEAADYSTPFSGTNIWASPVERALELKKQQAVMREQEWNAKPEFEKRRVVLSLEKGGVRRIVEKEKPIREKEIEDGMDGDARREDITTNGGEKAGAFGNNPLLGNLIRPVWKSDAAKSGGVERKRDRWRRVQDDNEDNEAWILDGGVYGDRNESGARRLGEEEHAFG